MKIDGFLGAMVGAILLALLAPSLGAKGGVLHLDLLTAIGIGLVFFLHGAALSPHAVKAGAANWRLHLFVHTSTFLLFPAIGFALYFGLARVLQPEVRIGLFFLAALPSTISSSVAMTAMARGNVAGAIFDATLSGLIGMVATPILVGLILATNRSHLELGDAIFDVMKSLLLPFAGGQLLRPLIGSFVLRNKSRISKLDRGVIVLIVYSAFCESTAAGIWSRYDPVAILSVALIVASVLAIILLATTWAARALDFSREDEIAAVFCGSKKSLANGAPIAAILFAGNPAMGMIMLPVMLYHQFQLIVCTMLARRYQLPR